MPLAQDLLHELKLEAAVTRRYLERVPFDQASYKPAEQSESLGRLAIHVAEIVAWWREVIIHDELDFIDFEPRDTRTNEELLSYFDGLLSQAEQALRSTTDQQLEDGLWSMRHGDAVYFTVSKKQALRIFCMNHLVHHRAQLGVYLRLMSVAVPATYGPSADDDEMILDRAFGLS